MSVWTSFVVVFVWLTSTLLREVALDTATALRSIPAHPEAFSVVLTDFLGEVRTIPIEFCIDAQVSYILFDYIA